MSWQADKAVPLLAGEPFCEKPPLTYWVAGAAIHVMGEAAWIARLPNLLYALVTALAVGLIARRSAGLIAGLAAAAAIGTFLLSYQVAIWLATDAPLLAAVAVALVGLKAGFYADGRRARLTGYSCMHVALALGFLAKSAAAWMVPLLTLLTLVVWERRWRELLRWELYLGLGLQAAIILPWVWVVYVGPAGPAHLKVFFWNNLVGRFAQVDAPEELQYAAAHRNSPGKYLIELPVYLWPWTLLVPAAVRRAWYRYRATTAQTRLIRFAAATFVPTLVVLSVAATARNIYLAPALPGIALLLGWWASDLGVPHDPWDLRAVRATAVLLLLATTVMAAAVIIVGRDSWDLMAAQAAAYDATDDATHGTADGAAHGAAPAIPHDAPLDAALGAALDAAHDAAPAAPHAAALDAAHDADLAMPLGAARDAAHDAALAAPHGAAPAVPHAATLDAPLGAELAMPDAAALAMPDGAPRDAAHDAPLAAPRGAALANFLMTGLGLLCAMACAISAWREAGQGGLVRGLLALLLSYASLLIGPASQLYAQVDAWQDLASIGRAIERDAAGRPLILFAPDETTRAFVDLYARPTVDLIPGPLTPRTADRLRSALASEPRSVVVTQLPGRSESRTLRELEEVVGMSRHAGMRPFDADETPGWAADARLRIVDRYALPNGRRYALLERVD